MREPKRQVEGGREKKKKKKKRGFNDALMVSIFDKH
jgi:hypothetical protein